MLQCCRYAILNEVWRLVADGVLNVKDIDSVMSDGLGMRYAFLGAFETAHLNAEGMANYFERYHKSIYDVSQPTACSQNRTKTLKSYAFPRAGQPNIRRDTAHARTSCCRNLEAIGRDVPTRQTAGATSMA